MNISKLDQAKMFLSIAIAVIPLRHRGKEPQLILSWEKYKTQLPTQYDLVKWFGSGWQNYGVVCGWNSLAVIDFDTREAFEMWHGFYTQYLLRVYEVMPFVVRTARGAHVYVRMPGGGSNQKRRGVDVKYHGYVVGPGSTHPSGTMYEAMSSEYVFPEVFSLDTFLPCELFPMIAETVATPIVPMPIQLPLHTEYDAFQSASFAGDGVDLITKVKSMVRIENMIMGTQRTSADSRWYVALCPFHDDHNPSMWIDTRRQLCGCNTCGMKPMDSINLYARIHNLNESLAVTELARVVGVWG